MAYARRHFRFYSSILSRELDVLHFGTWGYPMLLFPTSGGRFYDLEDQGIIAGLRSHLEQGYLQIFCLETLDQETLDARSLPIQQRRDRWLALERHWVEEFIPYAIQQAQNNFLVAAGCSLGGTHALNLALRHPQLVRRCLALAGPHDLANAAPLFSDYSHQDRDRELYFINPVAYMSNMNQGQWQQLGGDQLDIKLLTAHRDICLWDNLRLAEIFNRNGIRHQLEVWEGDHDWPVWRAQLKTFA